MATINKVVLNALSCLKAGDKVNFDYSVQDGLVTVDFVLIVRNGGKESGLYKPERTVASEGKSSVIVSKVGENVPWNVYEGETYSVNEYLYQKSSASFKITNGSVDCDVTLSDGTKLVSDGCAMVNGRLCYRFSHEIKVGAPSATNAAIINKIVLNAPKLTIGEPIIFNHSVKEGPVTVEWVTYVRQSDNKFICFNQEFPVVTAGKYTVHVYLYQKTGYTFREFDGSAICGVMLADGTALKSSGRMFANGLYCYHFSYETEAVAPAPVLFNDGESVQNGAKLISRVSWRKSSEGFSRYVKQLDELVAYKEPESSEKKDDNKTEPKTEGIKPSVLGGKVLPINEVVLNAPVQTVGKKISFDYTVNKGAVTIEWVLFVRSSDNKYIHYKKEYPNVTIGRYTVHVYLSPKSGNIFGNQNGNANCKVSLADGTELKSNQYVMANGKNCAHFSYEMEIEEKTNRVPTPNPVRSSSETSSSNVSSDHVRYVSCLNRSTAVAQMVIHYIKSGSQKWESKVWGEVAPGVSRTVDLVSNLDLPLDTLIVVEMTYSGKSIQSIRNLLVHPDTSKKAYFSCSDVSEYLQLMIIS